jgi:hypothetical protein
MIKFEEEQTTQWPKEKVQKDKQRSTEHTHTTIPSTTLLLYFLYQKTYPDLANDVQYRIKRLENT